MSAAFEARARAIGETFIAKGFARVELPVLQPADLFLDRLGDDVRSQIYVFTDPGGAEICLRPELTIPACRHYIERGTKKPLRLSYDGPVYRYAPLGSGTPQEMRQLGVESFGAADAEAEDSELVALCRDALAAGRINDLRLTCGDTALFGAFLETVALPPQWRGRLLRHFARADDFKKLLARLSAPGAAKPRQALLSALGQLSEDEARAVVEDVLALADIQPVGGRTLAEIAERFLEQAADASAMKLAPGTVELIEAFLAIDAPPAAALKALKDLSARAKLKLNGTLAALEARFARLEKAGLDLGAARFATAFGREMDYYSGFVFQLCVAVKDGRRVLAAGGRYDKLLTRLGAPRDIPAAGFAVFGDALAEAEAGR